jgi:catechol 2,3-dioxygenase-like lactoylglutathione lyase family enzyme
VYNRGVSEERLRFLSAVILVSEQPGELARFYREVLGIPLEDERHDGSKPHWGCTLGDLHFAIHAVSDFPEHPSAGVGAVKLAFTIFDLASFIERLQHAGIEPLYAPKQLGWCTMSAVEDPDGNLVELTELGDGWFDHLSRHRQKGEDVVSHWRRRKG